MGTPVHMQLNTEIWIHPNGEMGSLVTQMVKNLPAMQETWVLSLGWEDAWRIPWTEKPVDYSPWGHKESDMTERFHFYLSNGETHECLILNKMIFMEVL